ncbi:hypothetical protein GOP47_0028439 [Adiantum capillus-veneris]|nr:hypothetical protein GOP47_0028439 [Adiantum capillus-veneris]
MIITSTKGTSAEHRWTRAAAWPFAPSILYSFSPSPVLASRWCTAWSVILLHDDPGSPPQQISVTLASITFG